MHRFGANLVLLGHFAFVLFAVFGGFLLLLDRRWAWLHVPVVAWSSVVNLAAWTCPLTPLEKRLRASAAQEGYEGGFVQHYVGSLVYPGGMPRRFELVAGCAIVLWNLAVYAVLWWLTAGSSRPGT
ncbi:MAG TPA: DUF2784 domain-containing protein [Burkholderiales bacterium]|jgi:hypothetical protein|nr:DUF2784 domain-containing protein [Burkholderiales bacterium]